MKRDDMQERIVDQFRWSLNALALSSESQMAIFPDFVVVPDELALEYHYSKEAFISRASKCVTQEQKLALVGIDRLLSDMSRTGPRYSPELWEPNALSASPMWANVREEAKKALAAFGWSMTPPTPVSIGYVRGTHERQKEK